VRLGGDALHSTSKRCHSKTDGEREMMSIHAPFTWECTPRGIYVALCGTNQIEATRLRVHSTNEKLVRIRLLKLKVRKG